MTLNILLENKDTNEFRLECFFQHSIINSLPDLFDKTSYAKERFRGLREFFNRKLYDGKRRHIDWYVPFPEYRNKSITNLTNAYIKDVLKLENEESIMYGFLSNFIHSSSLNKIHSGISHDDSDNFILIIVHSIVV